jgi:hypothetical protein
VRLPISQSGLLNHNVKHFGARVLFLPDGNAAVLPTDVNLRKVKYLDRTVQRGLCGAIALSARYDLMAGRIRSQQK